MTATPELLYLLTGDPVEFAQIAAGMQAADMADALNALSPEAASRVLAALPFDLAVQVLDEPELEHRVELIQAMSPQVAGPLINGMSSDQQAEVFRELPERERSRLLPALDHATRGALEVLLRYPPDTAGGIMTTEFIAVPSEATVEETLQLIHRIGGAKETVYAIYVVDSPDRRLRHVVSLR